jgi:tetratricopeptide (TPR) repeat protein
LAINLAASVIYDFSKSIGSALLKKEIVHGILKKIGVSPQLNDFAERYVEALVELRIQNKSKEILNLFREKSIMQVFYDYYYGNSEKPGNENVLNDGLNHYIDALKVGDEVKQLNINVTQEIKDFFNIFSNVVHETRDVKEVETLNLLKDIRERLINTNKSDKKQELISNFNFLANNYYIEREIEGENILDKIHKQFLLIQNKPSIQVLHGFGGNGKTQIVINYIHHFKEEYQLIWWIKATSRETINNDYYDLAQELKIVRDEENYNYSFNKTIKEQNSLIIRQVRRQLEMFQRYLIVFDDFGFGEDENNSVGSNIYLTPEKYLNSFIPSLGNGHVLITSRITNWGNSIQKIHHITCFTPKEARDFLFRKLEIEMNRNEINPQEIQAIDDLTNLLGYLPLALEQAGAYIKEGSSITEYIQLFKKSEQKLLNWGNPYSDKELTVATTWDVTCQQMYKMEPLSVYFLNLCSFLASENIPEEYFKTIASFLQQNYPNQIDPIRLKEAQMILMRFSMIEIINQKKFVHCLVQDIIRFKLTYEKQIDGFFESALSFLNNIFEPNASDNVSDPESIKKCISLLPHIQKVVTYDYNYTDPIYLVQLLDKLGKQLKIEAQYNKAKEIFLRLIKLVKKYYKDNYHFLADVIGNLGLIYEKLGEYSKAITCYQRALTLSKGTNNDKAFINISMIKNNIGNVQFSLGKYKKALNWYKQALKIVNNYCLEDNVKLAVIYCNIGVAYEFLGKYPDALDNYNKSLNINESISKNSYYIALDHENIGDIYNLKGEYDIAAIHYQISNDIFINIFGTEHPDVATIWIKKATNMLQNNGDIEEVKKYFDQALTVDRKFFVEPHPNISRDLNKLGTLWLQFKQTNKAYHFLESALSMDLKFYKSDHPDIARDYESIGDFYCQIENYKEAESHYQKALFVFGRGFCKSHPTILRINQKLKKWS